MFIKMSISTLLVAIVLPHCADPKQESGRSATAAVEAPSNATENSQGSVSVGMAEVEARQEISAAGDRFSAWAGLCPGNNESAGKKVYTYSQGQPIRQATHV